VIRPAHVDRRRSLRWRLLAAVCAAVLLIWLLTGWLSYSMARHEAEELMDGSLAQTGHLLLAIIEDDEDELVGLANRLARARRADDNVYEPPLEFQVGRGDGTVLARSLDAPSCRSWAWRATATSSATTSPGACSTWWRKTAGTACRCPSRSACAIARRSRSRARPCCRSW
jgi:hypothetical protein